MSKHRATFVSKGQHARRRFVKVWVARVQRNAPALVGGSATVVVAGSIGAMLGSMVGVY